ncbi:MAG: hypothetical protein L0H70_06865 [Xanthomonadales bacterium]|nr:hypothetical protein [Xanthomonadales bacterium]
MMLFMSACTPNAYVAEHGKSLTLAASVRKATVCELAHWGHDKAGARVRVSAEYFTDLRHGAFLSDYRCPRDRLELAEDAPNAHKSVSEFNVITSGHGRYYIGHKFKVDVTGIFEWNGGRVINKELPPDRQYTIPPHGKLSLLKVWDFAKPDL